MFDRDELKEVREGARGFVDRDTSDDTRGRTSKKLFAKTLASSIAVVVALLFLTFSGMAVPATFGNVGGVFVEIGEIRGNDVSIYPAVGESAACEWAPQVEDPTDPADRALPTVSADLGEAHVPSPYTVAFTKDIRLPEFSVWEGNDLRIKMQRDPDVIPREANTTPYQDPPNVDPPAFTGQFIRNFNLDSDADLPNVDGLRESTAVDDSSGVRDLTDRKIYLVEGEDYSFDLTLRLIDETSINPEFQVEPAGVTAFIDWDNAGVEDDGEFEIGDEIPIGDAPATNDGLADVTESFTVPTGVVPSGEIQAETLMRVVMEVDEDSDDIQPGGQIDAGVTEEYTVVVVEDEDDIPARTEIGDINMKTSGLQADFLDLRADEATSSSFLLDDRYSDPEDDDNNPVFTSDGEFIIEAETALDDDENTRITDVTAQIHHAAFSRLSLSQLQLDIGFIDSDESRAAGDDCPVLTPGFIPEITDAPFNVQPDDDFTVNGTVTNPGDEVENQTLRLEFPEGDVDWEYEEGGEPAELEIEGGDTVYFDGSDEPPFDATAPSETGRFDLVLRPGEDEPTSQEVIVGDPPEFLIDIDEPTTEPDPVVATEESLTVNYSITNAGDVVGEQDIDLFFDGVQVSQDTESVEGASTSHDPDFSIVPSDGHAGDPVNVTVASEDDWDSVDVTILESPNFEVNITRAGNVTNPDSTVYDEEKWLYEEPIDARVDDRSGEHNESLGVEVNVTNTGDAEDTQDVELDITNSLGTEFENVDNVTDLTLDGGESEVFNLTFQPVPDRDVPEIDATVRSEDTTDDERGIRVTGEGAIYEILNLKLLDESGDEVDESDELPPGDTITAEFDVRNVGNEEGDQDIFLDILPDTDVPMGQPGDDSTYGTPTGDTYGVEEFSTSDPDGYEEPWGDDDSLFIDAARLREDPHRTVDWDELQIGSVNTGSGLDVTVQAVDGGIVVDSETVSGVSSWTDYDISDLQSAPDVAVEIEGSSDDAGSTWTVDEEDISVTYTVDGEQESIDVPKGTDSLLRDWPSLGGLYRVSHEHDRDDELGLGYVDPAETESETQAGADGFGWDVELYYRFDGSGDPEDFSGNDRTGDNRGIDDSFSGVFGSGSYEFPGDPSNSAGTDDRIAAPVDAFDMNSGGDSERATSVWVRTDGTGGGCAGETMYGSAMCEVGGVFHMGDSREDLGAWTLRHAGDEDEWVFELGDSDESYPSDRSYRWTFSHDASDWTHFVVTYRDSDTLEDQIRVYADGEEQTRVVPAEGDDFTISTSDRRNMRVGEWYHERGTGRSDDRPNFDGEIDEFMHFDRHLTLSEVRDLYLDGRWGDFEGRWEGGDRAAAPVVDHVSWNDGGYADFTSLDDAYPASSESFGNVSRGEDYAVELDVSGWTQYNYVFFDWTRSGDFEQYEDGSHYVGYTSDSEWDTASTSIPVPSHAEAGQTRMRVITNDDNLEDPAPDSYDGEAEDYAVFVEPDEGPEYIDAVRMDDIDMESGDDDGYANFTDMANSTRIFRGEDVDIEVDVMAGVRETQVYVWFDWDRSGEFTPGEDVMIGETDGEPGTVSGTVTVPFGAELGETRMRVMARSDAAGDVDDPPNPNPADGYLGETEDYAVVVDDPAGIKEGVDVNESVVLEPLELVENMTLEYTLEEEDAPGIAAQVRTDHDAESQEVGVIQSAVFDIIESDLETNQPITTDETLEVDFPIQNIGDLTGDVEAHLDVDQEQDGDYGEGEVDPVPADASVYPDADGDTESFDEYINAFEFESDEPEDDIDVVSGDDDGYADFTDEIAVVAPGETYDITVEYTGPQEGWQGQVAAWIDSEHTEDFDQTGDLEFDEYQDGDGDGVYEGEVEIPSDIETGATVMRVIGTFDDSPPDPNDFIDEPGEAEDYTIYVPDVDAAVDADLWPDGTGSAGDEHITNVEMGGEIDRDSGDDAYYDFTDDILTVEQGDDFEVTVEFDDGGFGPHYSNIYVDWDANEDWSTAEETEIFEDEDDDGQYSETVEVPDDAAEECTLARVRLSEGDFEDPDVEGSFGEVNDFTVCVGDPEISVDSDTATIDGGDTHDFTLEYEPAETDPPEVNIRVRAINLVRDALDDTAFKNNIQIDEPADFQIVELEVNDPVVEADTLVYTVTIENQGGVEDSQDVILEIDGETADERPLTLPVGEDEEFDLMYDTEVGDSPDVNFEVYTEDDESTGTSTVDGYTTTTLEDFGTSGGSYENTVNDLNAYTFGSGLDTTGCADDSGQSFLGSQWGGHYDGDGATGDIELRDGTHSVDLGSVRDSQDRCTIYFEGDDWSDTSMIVAEPDDFNTNLDYFPQRGEEIVLEFGDVRRTDSAFFFGVQEMGDLDDSDFDDTLYGGYMVYNDAHDARDDDDATLHLLSYDEDGSYSLVNSDYTPSRECRLTDGSTNTWQLTIEWDESSTQATIEDLCGEGIGTTVSTTDTQWDSGGVGHWSRNGNQETGMYGTDSAAHYPFDVWVESSGCSITWDSYNRFQGDYGIYGQDEVTSPAGSCSLLSDSPTTVMSSDEDEIDHKENYRGTGWWNEDMWSEADHPERGDRIRYWMKNHQYDEFHFGADADGDDGYSVEGDVLRDEVRLKADGTEQLTLSDLTLERNTWYEVVIDWGADGTSTDGDIYLAVLDDGGEILDSGITNHGTHSSGRIGYSDGGGDSSAFEGDYAADGDLWTSPVYGIAHDGDYVHDNTPIQEGEERMYTYQPFDSTADIRMHLRDDEDSADGSISNELVEFDDMYSPDEDESMEIHVDYTDSRWVFANLVSPRHYTDFDDFDALGDTWEDTGEPDTEYEVDTDNYQVDGASGSLFTTGGGDDYGQVVLEDVDADKALELTFQAEGENLDESWAAAQVLVDGNMEWEREEPFGWDTFEIDLSGYSGEVDIYFRLDARGTGLDTRGWWFDDISAHGGKYDASFDDEVYWSTYEWAGDTGDNSMRLLRNGFLASGEWYQGQYMPHPEYHGASGYAHDNDWVNDNSAIHEGESRYYTLDTFDSGADIYASLRDGIDTDPTGTTTNIDHEIADWGPLYEPDDGEVVEIEVDYTDSSEVVIDVNDGEVTETYDASGDDEVYWSTYEWSGTSGENSLRVRTGFGTKWDDVEAGSP